MFSGPFWQSIVILIFISLLLYSHTYFSYKEGNSGVGREGNLSGELFIRIQR